MLIANFTPAPQQMDPETFELIFMCSFMLGALIVWVFFLASLHKCFNRINPDWRGMSPGLVWLNLIPLFQLGWIFYTVIKLSEAVVREAGFRGVSVGDGGKGLGMAFSICWVASIIPLVGMCAGIASLVLMIIYWVKVAGFSRLFAEEAFDERVFM